MRSPNSAVRAAASGTLVAIAVATAACSISPQTEATVVGPAPALEESTRTTEEAVSEGAPGPPASPGTRRLPRQDRETISEDDG